MGSSRPKVTPPQTGRWQNVGFVFGVNALATLLWTANSFVAISRGQHTNAMLSSGAAALFAFTTGIWFGRWQRSKQHDI